MIPSPQSQSSTDSLPHPALIVTVEAVNWDVILQTVRYKLGAANARWGQQLSGGYNLVRFLLVDDYRVIVRLPVYPDPDCCGPMTPEIMEKNIREMSSMIASMEYVASHTCIPVPKILHSCLDPEVGNVRSPYVVMSEVEGKALSAFWDDMPDAQRDIVLEQVIDILLELSKHRFDNIGSLFRSKDGSWRIDSTPGETPEATYRSGTDQHIAIANARLQEIQDGQVFHIHIDLDYIRYWFLRSLIPCLYDNSLDAKGFPLMHGDFHTQNIFVVDIDTHPRITAIIDWDKTGTVCTSSFAQYPLFIVDHPLWEEDHPLRPRNVRDQASFNRLLEKAERKRFPNSLPTLSRAFASCQGIYLFEQCLSYDMMRGYLFPQLVNYTFGLDTEESQECWYQFTEGLERGVLKDIMGKLREESDLIREVGKAIGSEVELRRIRSRGEFIKMVRNHRDHFSAGSERRILLWLSRVTEGDEEEEAASRVS